MLRAEPGPGVRPPMRTTPLRRAVPGTDQAPDCALHPRSPQKPRPPTFSLNAPMKPRAQTGVHPPPRPRCAPVVHRPSERGGSFQFGGFLQLYFDIQTAGSRDPLVHRVHTTRPVR